MLFFERMSISGEGQRSFRSLFVNRQHSKSPPSRDTGLLRPPSKRIRPKPDHSDRPLASNQSLRSPRSQGDTERPLGGAPQIPPSPPAPRRPGGGGGRDAPHNPGRLGQGGHQDHPVAWPCLRRRGDRGRNTSGKGKRGARPPPKPSVAHQCLCRFQSTRQRKGQQPRQPSSQGVH